MTVARQEGGSISWNDPLADPLEDIRNAMAAMLRNSDFAAKTFSVPRWHYIRMQKELARAQMTKRGYRRWRGKFMADLRRQEREEA